MPAARRRRGRLAQPAAIDETREQRPRVATLRPVETAIGQALRRACPRRLDAELTQPHAARIGQLEAVLAFVQETAVTQAIEQRHAEPPREVAVAATRLVIASQRLAYSAKASRWNGSIW